MDNKKLFILTETELQNICGKFFDKGYYSAFYKADNVDKSTNVWAECKDSLFSEIRQSEVISVVNYEKE